MKAIKMIFVELILLVLPFGMLNAQFADRSSVQARAPFTQDVELAQYKFHSTSAMAGSGSSLPIAARNGMTFGSGTSDDKSSALSGRRRIGGSGSGTGGNEAEENDDPQETPIGDGVWAMLLMAAGYLIYRVRTRKREGMA